MHSAHFNGGMWYESASDVSRCPFTSRPSVATGGGALRALLCIGTLAACEPSRIAEVAEPRLNLQRGAVLAGRISVFDSSVVGASRTELSASHSAFESVVGTRGSNIRLPGSSIQLSATIRAASPTNLAESMKSVTTSSDVHESTDSSGVPHRVLASRLGHAGPFVSLEHRVAGKVVAKTTFDWVRVEGGWALERQRLQLFQDG